MSIRTFLPSKGLFAIVGIDKNGQPGRNTYHKWIEASLPDLDEYVDGAVEQMRLRNNCTDFYWSEGAFKTIGDEKAPRRRADAATAFRSYVMDVDCHGKAGEFRSPRAAMRHITDVLIRIDLLPTAVVFTGAGLQFIWSVDKDLKPQVWLDLAQKMWSIACHFGFRADPTRRRDRASIFRLPGTTNSRNGEEARIVYEGAVYTVRSIEDATNRIIDDENVPVLIEADREAESRDAADEGSVINHPQNSARLAQLLDVLPAVFEDEVSRSGHVRRSGYELWRSVVWAVKATGLPDAWDLLEKWAAPAARYYDDLDESLARTWDSDDDAKSVTTGPGTLVYLAKRHASARKKRSLDGFHFLDEDELRQLDGDFRQNFFDDAELFDCYGNLIFPEDAESWGDDRDEIEECPEASDFDEDGDPLSDSADGAAEPVSGLPTAARNSFQADYGRDYDDSAVGFHRNLAKAPASAFGSRKAVLPLPYSFATDSAGFGQVITSSGDDGEPVKEWRRISYHDIEYLETREYIDNEGRKTHETYMFRAYNAVTGRAESPFEVSGALMADATALVKLLRDKGIRCAETKGSEGRLRSYMNTMSALGAESKPPVKILMQGGWTTEDRNAFALGPHILTRQGLSASPSRIDDSCGVQMNNIGEKRGTLAAQWEILDLFGKYACTTNCALLALMLGSICSGMLPDYGGVVATWQGASGQGKTTTMKIGMGMFGTPDCLFEKGSSTLNYIDKKMATFRDIPLYVDELRCPDNSRDPAMKALRDFFLMATDGREKGRLTRGGDPSGASLRQWFAPLFVTTNRSPSYIIANAGSQAEAVYARILSIPYVTNALPIGVRVAGVPFNRAINENYGWIGRHFLHYVLNNQTAHQENLEDLLDDLSIASDKMGRRALHRFHNNKVACGIAALRWMVAQGSLPNWDVDAIEAYLRALPMTEDESVRDLAQNDIERVWTDFLSQNAGSIIYRANVDTHWQVPEDVSRRGKGIVARCDGAWSEVRKTALQKYCTEVGVPLREIMRYLADTYGGSVQLEATSRDLARGTKFLRQTGVVLTMPTTAIMAETPVSKPATAVSNVVALR